MPDAIPCNPTAILTERQAEAIRRRRYDQNTEPEAARLMKVTPRRVRYLIAEARRRLAAHGVKLETLPHGRPAGRTLHGDTIQFDAI